MKINYKQAAILYLIHWQMNEGNDESGRYDKCMAYIDDILAENRYPYASQVMYDNEAEPFIYWESFGAPKEWKYQEFLGFEGDINEEGFDTSKVLDNPKISILDNLIHNYSNENINDPNP